MSGNQGLAILAPGYPASRQIACATGTPTGDASATSHAGNSTLTYDATADSYVYVWKTDPSWANTCRELTVGLADGTIHQATVNFG